MNPAIHSARRDPAADRESRAKGGIATLSDKITSTVTFMFTDMVDSTAQTVDVPSAHGDAMRQELFALLRGALGDKGGSEVKGLGDGLMVVFPSVAAGVSCAVLTLQRAAHRNRRAAEPIHLRVGLSVGDAVPEDGDWFGRAPVEAARLCAHAQSDQILATDAVRVLSDPGGTPFRGLGTIALKGLSAPAEVCEVLWQQASGENVLPLSTLLATARTRVFAAREVEQAQLTAALDAAQAGSRQIALISGEPGIGKTTLAAEIAVKAHEGGVSVLYGRCEEDLALPYQPFVEALDHLVANAPEKLLAQHVTEHGGELIRLVPRLSARVRDTPEPPAQTR